MRSWVARYLVAGLFLGCASDDANRGGTGGATASGGAGGTSTTGVGGAGGAPSSCSLPAHRVYGCLRTPAPLGSGAIDLVEAATVASVIDGVPSDCGLDTDIIVLGYGQDPLPDDAIIAELQSAAGLYTLVISLPGLDAASLPPGTAIELRAGREPTEEHIDVDGNYVELWRDGALLAAINESMDATLGITDGDEICVAEGDVCAEGALHEVIVTVSTSSVTIPPGETRPHGDLLITNDQFLRVTSPPGWSCEFGKPFHFVVGAARAR